MFTIIGFDVSLFELYFSSLGQVNYRQTKELCFMRISNAKTVLFFCSAMIPCLPTKEKVNLK